MRVRLDQDLEHAVLTGPERLARFFEAFSCEVLPCFDLAPLVIAEATCLGVGVGVAVCLVELGHRLALAISCSCKASGTVSSTRTPLALAEAPPRHRRATAGTVGDRRR